MTLIANRQLTGDYGTVAPEQWFDVDQKTAEALIARGLARPATSATYETKVITPEVRPSAAPFRNVPDPDPEPPALAAVRAAVCSVSDVPAQGDPGRLIGDASDGPDPAVSETPAPAGQSDHRGDAKRGRKRGSR